MTKFISKFGRLTTLQSPYFVVVVVVVVVVVASLSVVFFISCISPYLSKDHSFAYFYSSKVLLKYPAYTHYWDHNLMS